MSILEKIKKGWSKFWNETLGPDYSTAELAELNRNSTDPTEKALAESLEKIAGRDDKAESSSKGGGRIQDQVKVKPDQLNKAPKTEVKAKTPKTKSADREMVD